MDVLHLTAFSTDPAGGNPAGVVLDASGLDDDEMQRVAARLGYSETAFLTPVSGGTGHPGPGNGPVDIDVRYFSPLAEVPFCGHATIASAVAYASRHGTGPLAYRTRAGLVPVTTSQAPDGTLTATLTSVAPRTDVVRDEDLTELLAALRWAPGDLDTRLPVRAAYAGAWHPVIAASTRERLATLDYDTAALGALMARRDWITIDLVWRESARVFHARNPFPPGGVFEDPATGAAAAAFGGYLREFGLVEAPATVTIHQGADMGRPSLLTVDIGQGEGGIAVTGTAVPLPAGGTLRASG